MTIPENQHSQALPPGQQLGPYRVIRVLGSGGFGITYLAEDLLLRTQVALKEYFPLDAACRAIDGQVVALPGSEDLFAAGRDQFLAEARLLANLRSQYVVRLRHCFESHGTACSAMEYLQGQTLEAHLQRQGGRIPYHHVLLLAKPLLEALEELHAHGCIHRDIKPENIYLTRQLQPILLDFGSARLASGAASGLVCASPGFSPPEQLLANGIQGPWSDIYALAATLYYLLTGVLPPAADARLAGTPLLPPSELVRLPAELEKWLLEGLDLKWSRRPENVAAWHRALQLKEQARKQRRQEEVTFIKLVILPKLSDQLLTPAEETEIYQAAALMKMDEDRVRVLIERTLEMTKSQRGDDVTERFVHAWLEQLGV
ncbi:MAG: serine/threonine-protein kinase [Candidatus Sericytochromatia bacterium]